MTDLVEIIGKYKEERVRLCNRLKDVDDEIDEIDAAIRATERMTRPVMPAGIFDRVKKSLHYLSK